jgi:VanZ family protein
LERRRVERGFFSRFMRYWLPVLIYLTVIFSLSAQPNLKPPVQFRNSDKLYHLLEYGGLGFLLTRALRAELGTGPAIAVGSAVLVLGSLVGAADETFQRSVPGRQSSAYDWVADTAGVALAQGLVLWLLGTRRREDRWL